MTIADHRCDRLKTAVLTSLLWIASSLPAGAVDVVLTGTYLKVGVNNSGGLIDGSLTTGIVFRPTGSGSFPSFDFLTPGAPYEFYSIGYGGSTSDGAGYSNGSSVQNVFNGVTTDTSSGSLLSTATTGSYGSVIGISQTMSFSTTGTVINFSVTLTNNSGGTLNNVVYARGLDPDQDRGFPTESGSYSTTNTIVNGDLVTAFAPVTGWTIGIFSNSAIAHTPSITSDWPNANPYNLLNSVNAGNGDYAINMAWNIGTLTAGQSVTIPFEYRVSAVPEPSTYGALAGLAVLAAGWLRHRRRPRTNTPGH